MDWFTDNPVTQALADFRKTLRETAGSSNAQALAAENADAFAEADWFLVRKTWATGEANEVPAKVFQDAHDGIRALTAALAISSDPVSDISAKLESLTTSLEGPARGPAPVPDVDFSGSVIDSKEVLNQQIGSSLSVLLEALVNQFMLCCAAPHWARLQLTGFLNQVDANSRPFFNLFLSSRYEGDPCRWLKSKCTIDTYVLVG